MTPIKIRFRSAVLLSTFCALSSGCTGKSFAAPLRKPYSYWLQKVQGVKRGMTWPQVKKLLPGYQARGFINGELIFSEGGGYVIWRRLDENWMMSVPFRHSNKKTSGAPRLFYYPLPKHQRPQINSSTTP